MKFHSNPTKQISFLKEIFQLNSSSRILDVGCHTGFHLQELQTISDTVDIEKPKNELKNFILGDVFTTRSALKFRCYLSPSSLLW